MLPIFPANERNKEKTENQLPEGKQAVPATSPTDSGFTIKMGGLFAGVWDLISCGVFVRSSNFLSHSILFVSLLFRLFHLYFRFDERCR